MTIHNEHPFLPPGAARDPARRLRGRLGGVVTLWTTGSEVHRAGLTISSLMVAPGETARVLALVDPDSDLADGLEATGRSVVQVLRWEHRDLADMFAGIAPAPGGLFAHASWRETTWGPVLDTVTTWAGVRVETVAPVGWSLLVTCTVEEFELGEEPDPLVHRRGRYLPPASG